MSRALSGGTALASRRSRREHASQEPLWDVWMLAAVAAAALLVAGGFLQRGVVGAFAGLVLGTALVGMGVIRNETARARLGEMVQAKLAASRHRGQA